MRNPNAEDIGSYWLGPDKEVWKLVSYCATPSVEWERVSDRAKRGGAADSPLAREFVRLVPERQRGHATAEGDE